MRYVHLPRAAVDTQLLEDATRRGAYFMKSKLMMAEAAATRAKAAAS